MLSCPWNRTADTPWDANLSGKIINWMIPTGSPISFAFEDDRLCVPGSGHVGARLASPTGRCGSSRKRAAAKTNIRGDQRRVANLSCRKAESRERRV